MALSVAKEPLVIALQLAQEKLLSSHTALAQVPQTISHAAGQQQRNSPIEGNRGWASRGRATIGWCLGQNGSADGHQQDECRE